MNQHSKALIIHCAVGAEVCLNDRKIYWRPRADLDVVIVRHPLHCCLEMAIYNPELDKEAPRIFLNSQKIFEQVDQTEAQRRIAERIQELDLQEMEYCPATVTKAVQDKMTMCYLLSSLHFNPALGLAVFAPDGGAAAMAIDHPEGLTPTTITFVKRVTVNCAVFCGALHDLHHEMKQATSFTDLTASNVDVFRRLFRSSIQWNHYKTAKSRWVKAIQSVIIQNQVKHWRSRLAAMEKAKLRLADGGDRRPHILRKHPEHLPKLYISTSPKAASASDGRDRTPSLPILNCPGSALLSRPATARPGSARPNGSRPSSAISPKHHSSSPCSPSALFMASAALPSLVDSFRKSPPSPKPLPSHRTYVLEDAIGRACCGFTPY